MSPAVAAGAVLLAVSMLAPSKSLAQPPPAAAVQTTERSVLLRQAAEAQQAGRNAEAMRLLGAAVERDQSVQACLELARMQSRSGDAPAALETLSKARAIAPNSEDVLNVYAQLALTARKPLPAVVTLQSLTRVYPTVAQYHYLLGVGLIALGDMTSALDSLAEADRLEPERGLTLLALGLALNNRKKYGEARTTLSRSLELQPESIEAIAALAEAEAGTGELERAAAHAGRALAQAPANATAHLVMGMVLMEQRKYADARDALLKAADADPDSPKPAYQLSLVYARLGDDANAQRYLERYREAQRGVEERLKAFHAAAAVPGPVRH